jgi:hypothetical protein
LRVLSVAELLSVALDLDPAMDPARLTIEDVRRGEEKAVRASP